ncbi:MAG: WYL domain-containing protein [Mariniblastus sp.]
MRRIIQKSMNQYDDFVVEFEYKDSKGQLTRRVVSPIRFVGGNRFLGLCLTREEPRQFNLDRCDNVQLKPAWDYVMPLAMMPVAMPPVAV